MLKCSVRRMKIVGPIVALAMVAAACGGSDAVAPLGGAPETSAAPTTTEAPTTESPTTEAPSRTEAPTVEAQALEFGGPAEPGTYATDLMGTEMSLELGDVWIAAAGDPGGFVLVDPEAIGTGDVILVTRMNSFLGQDDSGGEPEGQTLGGDSQDFQGWIDAVGALVLTSDEETNVGGNDARRVDFTVDPAGVKGIPAGCGPGPEDICYFVGGTGSDTVAFFIVRTTELYRMWFIDQGELDPILVTAIGSPGNDAFLEKAQGVVDSITLGEAQPHPVEPIVGPLWEAGKSAFVPAGTASVPALGGITFELLEDRFVVQEQNFLAIQPGETNDDGSPVQGDMIIALAAVQKLNTAPVVNTADFVAIVQEVFPFEPIDETITVLGQTLQGYELGGDGTEPIGTEFTAAVPGGSSNFTWLPGPMGTMFIGDHPDGGVLVVGYEGVDEAGVLAARAVFDEVLPTLKAS